METTDELHVTFAKVAKQLEDIPEDASSSKYHNSIGGTLW